MLLTCGYVVVAALLFATLSLSPVDLFTFPVVVTVWTAYLWVFTAQTIRSFSARPRPPRRVTAIIVVCGFVALAALAVSILIGVLMIKPQL